MKNPVCPRLQDPEPALLKCFRNLKKMRQVTVITPQLLIDVNLLKINRAFRAN